MAIYKQPYGRWYRLVPSHFPTVHVFEDCYDSAEELEVAFEIEALTNDRLRQEAGNLYLVPLEEWVTGAGATRVLKPLVDIAGESVNSRNELCDPENYAPAQFFSQQLRTQDECGIYYPSVRHEEHFNIAILKPTAISLTTQGAHYRYQWSGHKQAFIGYFKIANMHEVS